MTTFPLRENSGSASITKVGPLGKDNVREEVSLFGCRGGGVLSLLRSTWGQSAGYLEDWASVSKTESKESAGWGDLRSLVSTDEGIDLALISAWPAPLSGVTPGPVYQHEHCLFPYGQLRCYRRASGGQPQPNKEGRAPSRSYLDGRPGGDHEVRGWSNPLESYREQPPLLSASREGRGSACGWAPTATQVGSRSLASLIRRATHEGGGDRRRLLLG